MSLRFVQFRSRAEIVANDLRDPVARYFGEAAVCLQRVQLRPVDLDACAEAFGVTVEPGDTVLVRTGMMRRCREQQSWAGYFGGPAPGLSTLCARWIYEREIAAIATDTWGIEVRPYETPDCSQPLHLIAVRNMGLLIGEVFDLDALADACAEDQRYEFLFTAASLPTSGSASAPLNPLAIK